jgi:hypothetical protein
MVAGRFSLDWATTAAVRLNSNKDTKALTLTGLPNAWIGLLVAAFEGLRPWQTPAETPSET